MKRLMRRYLKHKLSEWKMNSLCPQWRHLFGQEQYSRDYHSMIRGAEEFVDWILR